MALSVTCCCKVTRVTTGERSDTETVTLRSERGDWKRAIARWYLASRLLNLVYLFVKDESKGRTEDLCWLSSFAEEQSAEHR